MTGRLHSSAWTWLLAVIAVLFLSVPGLIGLAQESHSQDNLETMSVYELVDGGLRYTGRLLQVKGCYYKNFEASELQPCEAVPGALAKYRIWVEDVRSVAAMSKAFTHERFIPPDQSATRKRRYLAEMTTFGKPLPVVVVGEYQTRDRGGYGHLGAYPHRFIVHQVVGEVPAPK